MMFFYYNYYYILVIIVVVVIIIITIIIIIIIIIIIMPEFLKTGLAKIRTHSTTWQLKTTRFVQRPIKKPISDAGQ